MPTAQLQLTVRLNTSAADARRGVVRLHPEALTALGLREWDAIALVGARRTASVAGIAPSSTPPGTILLDDVTMSNTGLTENATVSVGPVAVQGARTVEVQGSTLATRSIDEVTLRQALLGKVLTVGDTVSLLPRDLGPGTSSAPTTRELSRTFGIAWTNELLTVRAVDPAGTVSVQPNTAVLWEGGRVPARDAHPSGTVGDAEPATRYTLTGPDERVGASSPSPATAPDSTPAAPRAGGPERDAETAPAAHPRPTASDLVGVRTQVARLTEWLSLALDEPELLRTLGASPRLGVLVTGPAGVGKATFARAVLRDRRVAELDGPTVGASAPEDRLAAVRSACSAVAGDGVLLVTDVDALLPVDGDPVSTLILDEVRRLVATPGSAFVATTAHPTRTDPRLRDPDVCDRELAIPLPDATTRRALLEAMLRPVPQHTLRLDEIAARTPGFVAADLAALGREAALRAASRHTRNGVDPAAGSGPTAPTSGPGAPEETDTPALTQDDLLGALEVIRPLSRSETEELAVGGLGLDDVGDMVETKQALTEAVLWPLQHPESFERLGVDPPRGVLLYGPPGCGKTFLVRALAGSGQLSVHAVKGAELMDKWVGASERAVRDLFRRARDSAPSMIFLDEVDALAPRRGQSSDSGVGDRVVASLLTELDGIEPLRDVVVVGATNRPDLIDPALMRPGRLERLVFVPPPDAEARAAILRTSGRSVPLADDVDLDALAEDLDGYSAADCSALLRESALAAMRRDVDAAEVTAHDVATAREKVRPSLDPAQVEHLRAYAENR